MTTTTTHITPEAYAQLSVDNKAGWREQWQYKKSAIWLPIHESWLKYGKPKLEVLQDVETRLIYIPIEAAEVKKHVIDWMLIELLAKKNGIKEYDLRFNNVIAEYIKRQLPTLATTDTSQDNNGWISVSNQLPAACKYKDRHKSLCVVISDRGHYHYEALAYYGEYILDETQIGWHIISQEHGDIVKNDNITHYYPIPEFD